MKTNKLKTISVISDAKKAIVSGIEPKKDTVAKIICSDLNFLGRTIKCLFKEYKNLSDEEAGNLISNVKVEDSNRTGTLSDLGISKKYVDVSFSIKERPVEIRIFLEPNFYEIKLNEVHNRSLEYGCAYYLIDRSKHKSDYSKGIDVEGIWILNNKARAGSSIIWEGVFKDSDGKILNDIEVNSHIRFHFCYINDEFEKVDSIKEPLVSFYSTVFTRYSDKNDKIKLLEDKQSFKFKERAQEEIQMNGLAQYYREIDANRIKTSEEKLQAKDQESVNALKGIMSSFNIDFDKAFEVAKYDASLKDKYRKLINEE